MIRFFIALGVSVVLTSVSSAREWKDTKGRAVEADFVRLVDNTIHLLPTGASQHTALPLTFLSKEDQTHAKGLWAAKLNTAVKELDAIVEKGCEDAGIPLNPYVSDEQFVRRAYVDITGTIPTYKQTQSFLSDGNQRKRPALINTLLASEGYVSHLYNYFAEQFRVQDQIPGRYLRTDLFEAWLKENIKANRPFNEMTHDMLAATGALWENPAVGFQLRDYDTALDHVQYNSKVLLGTDIACAQCHDDPFQDWTQQDYYQLTAYLDAKQTIKSVARQMPKGEKEKIDPYLIKKYKIDTDTEDGMRRLGNVRGDYNQIFRWLREATELAVHDDESQELRYPDNGDVPAGDKVEPAVLFGEVPAHASEGTPREQFAAWLTADSNPRFATNMANRMWARYFGRGILEPLYNIDPSQAATPELLEFISRQMVEVGFNLKEFSRIILNSRAYQRLASKHEVNLADDYYFQGPILRRMTGEQVWDSLVTLMVNDPMRFKGKDGLKMLEVINVNNKEGDITFNEYIKRVEDYQAYTKGGTAAYMFDSDPAAAKRASKPASKLDALEDGGEAMMMMGDQSLDYGKLILARASELPQPVPAAHFLRKFGASDRNFVIDASSKQGSVPQVLEMMNGFTTEMLTKQDSLIFNQIKSADGRMEKADVIFLSILNRKAGAFERDLIYKELEAKGDAAYSDIIWALLNSPEFFFCK